MSLVFPEGLKQQASSSTLRRLVRSQFQDQFSPRDERRRAPRGLPPRCHARRMERGWGGRGEDFFGEALWNRFSGLGGFRWQGFRYFFLRCCLVCFFSCLKRLVGVRGAKYISLFAQDNTFLVIWSILAFGRAK